MNDQTPVLKPPRIDHSMTMVWATVILAIAVLVCVTLLIAVGKSAADVTLILALIVPTVAGVVGIIKAQEAGSKTDRLEVQIDGRMTELLALNKAAAEARGNLAGRAESVAENSGPLLVTAPVTAPLPVVIVGATDPALRDMT